VRTAFVSALAAAAFYGTAKLAEYTMGFLRLQRYHNVLLMDKKAIAAQVFTQD